MTALGKTATIERAAIPLLVLSVVAWGCGSMRTPAPGGAGVRALAGVPGAGVSPGAVAVAGGAGLATAGMSPEPPD